MASEGKLKLKLKKSASTLRPDQEFRFYTPSVVKKEMPISFSKETKYNFEDTPPKEIESKLLKLDDISAIKPDQLKSMRRYTNSDGKTVRIIKVRK